MVANTVQGLSMIDVSSTIRSFLCANKVYDKGMQSDGTHELSPSSVRMLKCGMLKLKVEELLKC